MLTHNYTGNVMVTHARRLGRRGKLGALRKVVVEYSQGWLSSLLEGTGQKQAVWRTEPKRNGAKGVLHASQICVGEESRLSIRVPGAKAGLEWCQEEPNELILKYPDQPRRFLRRGNNYPGDEGRRFTRVPSGHPEGYLEAFGNIDREAFRAIRPEVDGRPLPRNLDFPTADDGAIGMAFIETVVKSARLGAKWVKFPAVQAATGLLLGA